MRPNNFDLVRLLLAASVVFVHTYALSGEPSLRILRQLVNPRLPVECFFVISGFLIFASFERNSNLRAYFTSRARRILPGYWLSTLLCVAIAFCQHNFHIASFLLANLSFLNFLHPSIGTVFAHNPQISAMNGALWTIKVEVMFYISVPLIVWACRRLNRDMVLATLFFASLLCHWALSGHDTLQAQLPAQLCFFMAGAFVYYHFEIFKRRGWWYVAGAVLMLAGERWTGWFALRPAAIAVLVLAACFLLPHVEGPARWGDFSYGTYVLHWPIIQIMVSLGLFAWRPWTAMGLTIATVAACAVLSWNFVEKPALTYGRSRRAASREMTGAANYPPAVP